jgi:hypothetical protein
MEHPVGQRPVLSRAGAPDRVPVVGVAVVAMLVVVALFKPWPSGEGEASQSTGSSAPASPASPASPEPHVALPTMALDPPATDCYADSGWEVCMLGETDGQEIKAWWGRGSGTKDAAIAPTTPAVLLITNRGAGLGLYAPRTSKERLTGQSVVSAWMIKEGTGVTSWIALRRVASVGTYDVPAGSVYRPPPEGLGSAARWPAGRYILRLQAATGGWERWFAMEVSGAVSATGGLAPQ